MSVTVSITLNGESVSAAVEPSTLLVELIREHFRLTGTHVGCDTSQCGACVVHVNGCSVKSCTLLAVQVEGADISTIESLAKNGRLHPMQQAFKTHHGLQCGFCTPGIAVRAAVLLRDNPAPSRDEIAKSLKQHICRCTGYHNIVSAVASAGQKMREA